MYQMHIYGKTREKKRTGHPSSVVLRKRTVETANFEALLVELATRGLGSHAAAERGGALANNLGAALGHEGGVVVDAKHGK